MTRILVLIGLLLWPTAILAQTSVSFGAGEQDPEDPIEVTAEALAVDETSGAALYTGNVIMIKGDMRMASPRLLVLYSEETDDIISMVATGGVTVVRGEDAAESQRADYAVQDDVVVMTDDVLLTQKRHAMTSQRMVINLEDNTAHLTGRVKTIIQNDESSE